jgi:ABC-type hemin transport system ATPase subunit
VVLLDVGRLTADGPPDEVLASPEATRAFGVELAVGRLPDGTPFVVPRRETAA